MRPGGRIGWRRYALGAAASCACQRRSYTSIARCSRAARHPLTTLSSRTHLRASRRCESRLPAATPVAGLSWRGRAARRRSRRRATSRRQTR
eukprot:6295947-Prymnesium_polylepis.1